MSISRRALFGKLGVTLYRSMESATALCKIRQNRFVELAHWLHQLLQLSDSDLHRILRHAGIDCEAVERDVVQALNALPAGASALSDFSHHIDQTIERAWILTSIEFGERRIRGAWLIAALLGTPDLRRVMLSISPAFGRIPSDDLASSLIPWIDGSPERTDAPYDSTDFSPAEPGDASQSMSRSPGSRSFEQYCQDLTARA